MKCKVCVFPRKLNRHDVTQWLTSNCLFCFCFFVTVRLHNNWTVLIFHKVHRELDWCCIRPLSVRPLVPGSKMRHGHGWPISVWYLFFGKSLLVPFLVLGMIACNIRSTVPSCFCSISVGNCGRVSCSFDNNLSGSWRSDSCCCNTTFYDGLS